MELQRITRALSVTQIRLVFSCCCNFRNIADNKNWFAKKRNLSSSSQLKHCMTKRFIYLPSYRFSLPTNRYISKLGSILGSRSSTMSSPHEQIPTTNFISFKEMNDPQDLNKSVNVCSTYLLNGGVIAVPTDTIYGIAGLSQKIDAVNRIYEIKQRNYQKPVAISVGSVDDIYRWSKVTVPRDLLTDLLPGPVTVVFERSPELNPSLNPNTTKVGIRIPGNDFMQQLAVKCGSPIALTSANISGGSSCLQTEEFQHLWPQLDLVVNGGVLNDTEESRLGSTVVDLSAPGCFRVIRNGSAYQPTTKILMDKYSLKNATSLSPSER